MELHHLRYFAAVAEEQSFTRAAERLHMAASPLSRRIKDLEHELGVTLFVRSYHSVSLTEAGATLWPHVKDVLRRVDELTELLPSGGTAKRRTVSVGMGPELSPLLHARINDVVAAIDPDVTLRPVAASTGPLMRSLMSGELDVALVHGRVADPQVRAVRVESQPAAVVVTRDAGFDPEESVDLSELAHLPYVSLKESAAPLVYRATDELLLRHGVRGRIHISTNNQADLVPVVVAGQAFTICGEDFGATHKVFVDEPIVLLRIAGVSVELTTYAVWRVDDYERSPVVRALVEGLKECFSQFVR